MKDNSSIKRPKTLVHLNHPITLPVYKKLSSFRCHPKEGPAIALLSGGSGARKLSETLIHYTHNSSHILPTFDDGGSSRELRQKLNMPPPGDLRNRLIALADKSIPGNAELCQLFLTRLPKRGSQELLQEKLELFLDDSHPQMSTIERRRRRIIINFLETFFRKKPVDFDLRGGNIGNFIIAGAFLCIGDLESVIFELSSLASVRGHIHPVSLSHNIYHLKAELDDDTILVGQSQITGRGHAAIRRLSIVEEVDGSFNEVQPQMNPSAIQAIHNSNLIAYVMGSFYTSILSNLLVTPMGQSIRETKRPKVFIANLTKDYETPGLTVSKMLQELFQYLKRSDPQPGKMKDYVHYALVNNHGENLSRERMPVDIEAIRALGVEPIILPLEDPSSKTTILHDSELVASALLSLC